MARLSRSLFPYPTIEVLEQVVYLRPPVQCRGEATQVVVGLEFLAEVRQSLEQAAHSGAQLYPAVLPTAKHEALLLIHRLVMREREFRLGWNGR